MLKGIVKSIKKNGICKECAIIQGEDNQIYEFSEKNLKPSCQFDDINIGTKVGFEAKKRNKHIKQQKNNAFQVSIIQDMEIQEEAPIIEEISMSEQTSAPKISDQFDEKERFFAPGYAGHLDKNRAFEGLKDHEADVIEKLSKVLYISRIGYHLLNMRSRFEFCMAGTTELLKQFVP